MPEPLDLAHVRQHADLLSALGMANEGLRLAMLTHGGPSLQKAVRHGLILARDHAGPVSSHASLSEKQQQLLKGLHEHVHDAPKGIRTVIDQLIELGPHGHNGQTWRDVIEAHRDSTGGSFFGKIWHGIKHGANAVGHAVASGAKTVFNKVLKPGAKLAEKELEKVAKKELQKVLDDPIGTAVKLAEMA